jgi:trehalose 6-phosphate phosphatase
MYLFSEVGLQVVESLSFTRTLYAFDYDGTLAPIVAKPEDAKAAVGTEKLLNELSQVAAVAIISGRSISDLRTMIDFKGKHLIGNHGLEREGARRESNGKAASTCTAWVKQLKKGWGSLKSDKGVFIEDKAFSLALHYRGSRNKKKARLELLKRVGQLKPTPRLILGKCAMNLLPTGGPHKGMALLETMMKLNVKCAFYIGDDDTDEDVFSLPDHRIISVRVGMKKASQAQFFIKRQSEMNKLLKKLISLNRERGRYAK